MPSFDHYRTPNTLKLFFKNRPEEYSQTALIAYSSCSPYFLCFLKILKVCFLRLAVESVSSPVEPLSSSSGLFLEDSCGMRVLPFAPTAPGCPPPVGDGVSGSVELGLRERDDSDILLISPRLGEFSMPYIFFMSMGLSETGSAGLAS